MPSKSNIKFRDDISLITVKQQQKNIYIIKPLQTNNKKYPNKQISQLQNKPFNQHINKSSYQTLQPQTLSIYYTNKNQTKTKKLTFYLYQNYAKIKSNQCILNSILHPKLFVALILFCFIFFTYYPILFIYQQYIMKSLSVSKPYQIKRQTIQKKQQKKSDLFLKIDHHLQLLKKNNSMQQKWQNYTSQIPLVKLYQSMKQLSQKFPLIKIYSQLTQKTKDFYQPQQISKEQLTIISNNQILSARVIYMNTIFKIPNNNPLHIIISDTQSTNQIYLKYRKLKKQSQQRFIMDIGFLTKSQNYKDKIRFKNQPFLPNYNYYNSFNKSENIEQLHKQRGNYYYLQSRHDYIQWMFPNHFASMFNSQSSPLGYFQVQLFRKSKKLGLLILKSAQIFFDFLGLELKLFDCSFEIIQQKRLNAALNVNWHNHLRLKRLLACLSVTGFRTIAVKFIDFLKKLTQTHDKFKFRKTTFQKEWKIYGNTNKDEAIKLCFHPQSDFPKDHEVFDMIFKEEENKYSINHAINNGKIKQSTISTEKSPIQNQIKSIAKYQHLKKIKQQQLKHQEERTVKNQQYNKDQKKMTKKNANQQILIKINQQPVPPHNKVNDQQPASPHHKTTNLPSNAPHGYFNKQWTQQQNNVTHQQQPQPNLTTINQNIQLNKYITIQQFTTPSKNNNDSQKKLPSGTQFQNSLISTQKPSLITDKPCLPNPTIQNHYIPQKQIIIFSYNTTSSNHKQLKFNKY